MADVIKFNDKKFEDEGDAILEDLLRPERSGDVEEGETGETGGKEEKGNLIHLPKTPWPPIDWEEVEKIMKEETNERGKPPPQWHSPFDLQA